jgi:hypothetical protein
MAVNRRWRASADLAAAPAPVEAQKAAASGDRSYTSRAWHP